MMDVNNPTGTTGVLAIDKRGSHALFLDPNDYTEVASLDLPARPHELAISADHRTAYVSIYGSGVYGANPEPGHLIVVLHLPGHEQIETIDVSPYRAPHGLMLDPNGFNPLYASCDHSGVIAVVDPRAGKVVGAIDADSHGPHMIALLPDGTKLYSENEEDPFVSVMEPASRRLVKKVPMPGGSAGICASADGQRVLVVAGQQPALVEIDTHSDMVTRRVTLEGHRRPAQRVRCSPDGRFIVVTSTEEPLVTVLDAGLEAQTTFSTAAAPMGVAFAADGRTALVANHGAGRVTVVDLQAGIPTSDFAAGVGVETLAFY
jgi:DNA-binding beta-propeller fold protein YncE